MSDMREDLNAALDSVAKDDETQNYDETVQTVQSEEGGEASSGAAAGPTPADTANTADTAAASPPTDTAEKPAADSAGADTADTAAADSAGKELGAKSEADQKELAAGDSIKAPVDWSPKEREDWSKIPRHLQDKVMAREQEINNVMQSTATARRTHDEFGQLANQYGSILAGVAGDTPMEAVKNLFSTVANLRVGSPQQKAEIIAGFISEFGVDINTLDAAIVGAAATPEQAQSNEIERQVNERMAPFEKLMGNQNAYELQQHNQRTEAANTEVQKFSEQAEFLGDVRMDMADLIDMASQRGQDMSMEEAYKKACMLNPQVQEVLNHRAELERLNGSSSNIAAKQNAASSITGLQVGGGGDGGNMSMRDSISAAWDSQNKI